MDENIACQEKAFGTDCSAHFNAIANRVGTAIICANIDDAVHAMIECLANEGLCGLDYANALKSASGAFVNGAGDVGRFRADVCNAFPKFEQRCMPFPIRGACTAAYAEFAKDLYTLSLAGSVCTTRDLSHIYTKYGFTANGHPLIGHSHKISILDGGYRIAEVLKYDNFGNNFTNDDQSHLNTLGHGMVPHAHIIASSAYNANQNQHSGGSYLTISWLVLSLITSLVHFFRY